MPLTPDFDLPYPAPADPPDGPAQLGALATAVEAALADLNTSVSTGGDNGGGTQPIPAGNTWTDTPDAVIQVPVAGPGKLLVFAVVTLNDPGTAAGDCEARLQFSGPIGTVILNVAKAGVSQGAAVTITVPVNAVVPVTAAGTVSITRQVRHNLSSGRDGQYYSFDVSWLLVDQT